MGLQQIARPKYEIKTMAKYSSDGQHRYSLSYDWSGDESERAIMVITNYPGKSDGVTTDLTTSLIINNVKAMNFNKVVMTNLFSKMNITKNTSVSIDDFTASTDMITLLEAKEVGQIVIATGSFPKNNKLAYKRQQELIKQLKKAGFQDKLQVLVDECTNKPVHPLAVSARGGWNIIRF